MRIKEGFKMRSLLKEYVVTAEGSGQVNFNKIIALNQTAAFLWEKVSGRDFNESELVSLLLEEYDVTEDVASADVCNLVLKWREAGLIDD